MIVKGEDVTFMGEWAELKKNHLLEEKTDDYEEFTSEDMLIEYLTATEDRLQQAF